ncbi:leukemia NUP98 fusion partner 1 isoform X1 [Myotis myotis]|uniref:Leukemia NUP98 fusion partner 1 n=1 Tax=Myotis myotis TaxID=51298 RepID=A0A7J7ZWZ8_MYOMY|nr:leukemia NUP98 fusion partner 1 isoform X1 [Myotis myotis]KAF6378628.1 leukemia NUP98 fusion partner 1 [Myotis myotis]
MEHRDDDDDDDVSFAKWMSSFWGHSWIEEDERGLRARRGSQDTSYRKASLPCPFPVLPRVTSYDSHPRRHSHEDQGFRCRNHMRDYRKRSEDGPFKDPLESNRRSHSKTRTFSESFEQQLCFRTKRSLSLGPESRRERNERESLRMETRSREKAEERGSSRKEEHGEAHMVPLSEKGPK